MLADTTDQRRLETRVLGVLILNGMLAFSYNGVLGPFLPAIARTLDISVGDAAWLAAATAFGWITSAALAPRCIAHGGAKRIMLVGWTGMALTLLITPFLHSLGAILPDRLVGGIAGGLMGPSANVYLIEQFPPERQGRAFGWMSTGFALGGALLLPLLVFGSSLWAWQGSFVVQGALMMILSIVSRFLLPPDHVRQSPMRSPSGPQALAEIPLALLSANLTERIGYAIMVTFWPTLFIIRYHWSLSLVAVATGVMYCVGAFGSVGGGALLSRYHWRETSLYVLGVGLGGVMVLTIFAWAHIPSWGYVLGGCVYAFGDSAARPAYFQLMARSMRNYQKAMGWFAISNQLGSLTGNMAIPFLVAPTGYLGLGWAGVLLCFAAIGLVVVNRTTQFHVHRRSLDEY